MNEPLLLNWKLVLFIRPRKHSYQITSGQLPQLHNHNAVKSAICAIEKNKCNLINVVTHCVCAYATVFECVAYRDTRDAKVYGLFARACFFFYCCSEWTRWILLIFFDGSLHVWSFLLSFFAFIQVKFKRKVHSFTFRIFQFWLKNSTYSEIFPHFLPIWGAYIYCCVYCFFFFSFIIKY